MNDVPITPEPCSDNPLVIRNSEKGQMRTSIAAAPRYLPLAKRIIKTDQVRSSTKNLLHSRPVCLSRPRRCHAAVAPLGGGRGETSRRTSTLTRHCRGMDVADDPDRRHHHGHCDDDRGRRQPHGHGDDDRGRRQQGALLKSCLCSVSPPNSNLQPRDERSWNGKGSITWRDCYDPRRVGPGPAFMQLATGT